jgi:hypothetical protein
MRIRLITTVRCAMRTSGRRELLWRVPGIVTPMGTRRGFELPGLSPLAAPGEVTERERPSELSIRVESLRYLSMLPKTALQSMRDTGGAEQVQLSPSLVCAVGIEGGVAKRGARGTPPWFVSIHGSNKFVRAASANVHWVSQVAISSWNPEGLCFAVVPLMRPLMANKSVVVQQ